MLVDFSIQYCISCVKWTVGNLRGCPESIQPRPLLYRLQFKMIAVTDIVFIYLRYLLCLSKIIYLVGSF